MKLQAKFTLNLIFLVIFTIVVSFFLTHWSVQSQFRAFIQEKNQQWLGLHGRGNGNNQSGQGNRQPGQNGTVEFLPVENPFDNPVLDNPQRPGVGITPEQNYLRTLNVSLFWAGSIVIIFAVVLGYFLSRFLLRRVHQLQSAMSQYIEDGVSKPVLHDDEDEVDDLARIYNVLIEKIEKEEKIRKDFFVDMSHELRTPLTSVKGYLEGLIDEVFDAEKQKMIHEKALGETDRMIHLVKEMTTLAKLESEKAFLKLEDTDLRSLSEEVADMLSGQAEERGVHIEVHGNAQARVDVHKFKQVIINLMDNATHYAQKNSTISVEIGKNNDLVSWKITNKFEGTPPENVEYFFERFYRGDKSRTYNAQKPHLGIGLNIVKKIVEQHGGKVTVSVDGNDICFEVTL